MVPVTDVKVTRMEDLIKYELHIRRILAGAKQIGAARISMDGIPYDKYVEFITGIARSMFMDVKCSKTREGKIYIKYLNKPKREKLDFSMLKDAGDAHRFEIDPSREPYFRSKLSAYARARGLASAVEREAPGRLIAKLRAADPIVPPSAPAAPGRPRLHPSQLKYPIAELNVGESVLIELPPTEHDKVRKSVSARARVNGWRMSCAAEGDGIRVTRTA